MITKEQCKTLKVGDIILFGNNWRQIIKTGQHPRGNILYFYFNKLKGNGITAYTNYEFKHKVKCIMRLK
jgi:hypothetical protein